MYRIADCLIDKYPYLQEHVSREFLVGKKQNEFNEHTTTFLLSADLASKFSNKLFPGLFLIQNILVWNNREGRYTEVELDILEGMLCGYNLTCDLSDLDICNIDTTQVAEKHFRNEDKEEVMRILEGVDSDIIDQLDVNETFQIEIEGGVHYVIKNLGDGDYISIDKEGAVYRLTHDPYCIELLYETKEEFFDNMEEFSW